VIPPDLFAVQFYLVAGVFSSIRNLENFKINRPAIGPLTLMAGFGVISLRSVLSKSARHHLLQMMRNRHRLALTRR
jgi:hypothetical protein